MSYLNFIFSKEHREKIGKASSIALLGRKHSKEHIKHSIEAIVKMPYEDYIKTISLSKLYRRHVDSLSHKQPLYLLKNFKKEGFTLDHIFPVKLGFIYKIPEEMISDMLNLRYIKKFDNQSKSYKLPKNIPKNILIYLESRGLLTDARSKNKIYKKN